MHPYAHPHRRHSHTNRHQQPLPHPPQPRQQPHLQTPITHTYTRQPTPRIIQSSETWTGFIKDHADAKCIVESVVAGQLLAVNNFPVMMSGVRIRSGTVLVFAEKTAKVEKMRWRDGLNWSYSRISGSFLLYREVEPIPQYSHNNTPPQILENSEFILRSVRPNTQLIPGGLAKRTMTVEGSCGTKFRLINYFYPNHVQHHYDTISSINSNNHAVLHTPRQDASLRRYYNHPLEPANSRDATPPLAVMSPTV
ncbi:Gti1/Pac2 family-domain-containing protein [Chytriomyces cf. hyalinus JEL632]|nr:Gti1/Pac2 family-domain-containing protein [Chytriomyces cf. hyalinus JEL632]